jgi:DNA-binding LacI/PurR family transcriptional regulator
MHAVNERGPRVPEVVALVSYNDIDLAAWVKPRLTTAPPRSHDMGVAAILNRSPVGW